MRALSDTVLCLNQTLEQLRNENQSLKEDLVEALENTSQNKVLQNLNYSKTVESVNQNKTNFSKTASKYLLYLCMLFTYIIFIFLISGMVYLHRRPNVLDYT